MSLNELIILIFKLKMFSEQDAVHVKIEINYFD